MVVRYVFPFVGEVETTSLVSLLWEGCHSKISTVTPRSGDLKTFIIVARLFRKANNRSRNAYRTSTQHPPTSDPRLTSWLTCCKLFSKNFALFGSIWYPIKSPVHLKPICMTLHAWPMAQGAVKNQNHPKSRCFLERKLPKGNISWCPHLKISIKRRKKSSRNIRNLYSPNFFAFSVNVKKDLPPSWFPSLKPNSARHPCVFFLVAVLFKTAYLIYIFFLPLSSERTKNKTQFRY